MLKNILPTVFVITALFVVHCADATARSEELNSTVDTIVATGNIDKYCYEMKILGKQCLKDPAFTRVLQEAGIPNDKIDSFKKCMKKFVKASVDLIKIESDLRAANNPSLLALLENPLRLLVLANSPHAQEMQKKWDALMEDMKQNNMSKQNA